MKRKIKSILERLSITKLKRVQQTAVQHVEQSRDTILILRTSGGKSLVYHTAALLHPKKLTVVITPLIALMRDQVTKLKKADIRAEYLYAQCPHYHQTMKRLEDGKVSLLYLSPERGVKLLPWLEECYGEIHLVVIDEAHCISEWGNAFRPAYVKIGATIQQLNSKPTLLACSATLTEEDQDFITGCLGMEEPVEVRGSLNRKNLVLHKMAVPNNKERYSLLEKWLGKYAKKGRCVVYCTTIREVEAVHEYLVDECEFPSQTVCRCHSELTNREEEEERFALGQGKIMVATSAFGMGIDIPDVRLVVLFSLPLSLTSYAQQMGRAGRDGRRSHILLLHGKGDYKINQHMLEQSGDERALEALDEMREYAQSEDLCMMSGLLAVFGEDSSDCGVCAVCKERDAVVVEDG